MRSSHRSDLIVVGLGPAGASAAAAAAAAGLSVTAVDRKKTPGLPVQCAEFIPGPLYGEIPGLSLVTRQPIDAMHTMIAASAAHISPDFRGAMVDRARFDAMLVDAAREAGADIRFGAPAIALDADGLHLQDGSVLDADIVIGADGPNSIVGRAIGSVNRHLVFTRQVTVPLRRPHQATDIFLSADYPGGYAWLFPSGDRANLGLGVVRAESRRLRGLLHGLQAQLVQEKRIGPEILARTGGAIPTGGMLRPTGTAHGRTVLLAGDAAGLTNPVTGAGIASAVMSGRMAGEAAAARHQGRQDASADYEEQLLDIFGPSLERAVARRDELLRIYSNWGRPDARALRRGWIAFPEYWSDPVGDQALHDERAYA